MIKAVCRGSFCNMTMKKYQLLLIILTISLIAVLSVSSCNAQQDVSINLTVYNKSGKTLDSIAVYCFDKEETIYNVPKDTIFVKNYTLKKSSIPKGESAVFYLYAFDKQKFYFMSNGFVGFPTAYIKDEYNYYIYDTYIATKEGFVPPEEHRDHRHNLEEYGKM